MWWEMLAILSNSTVTMSHDQLEKFQTDWVTKDCLSRTVQKNLQVYQRCFQTRPVFPIAVRGYPIWAEENTLTPIQIFGNGFVEGSEKCDCGVFSTDGFNDLNPRMFCERPECCNQDYGQLETTELCSNGTGSKTSSERTTPITTTSTETPATTRFPTDPVRTAYFSSGVVHIRLAVFVTPAALQKYFSNSFDTAVIQLTKDINALAAAWSKINYRIYLTYFEVINPAFKHFPYGDRYDHPQIHFPTHSENCTKLFTELPLQSYDTYLSPRVKNVSDFSIVIRDFDYEGAPWGSNDLTSRRVFTTNTAGGQCLKHEVSVNMYEPRIWHSVNFADCAAPG